jgi:1-acyl-sn-glycerol-3-phosphate acyltransferase
MPGSNQALIPLGAVRAGHETAGRLFEAGKKTLVYPGGDVDKLRPWRQRDRIEFDGRDGFARLAIRHDVPVIPVVVQGAHSTVIIVDDLHWLARLLRTDRYLRVSRWPLMISLPWGLTLGPSPPYFPLPAKIRIEFLEPVGFRRTGLEASRDDVYVADCARRLRWRMQSALDRLAGRIEPEPPGQK